MSFGDRRIHTHTHTEGATSRFIRQKASLNPCGISSLQFLIVFTHRGVLKPHTPPLPVAADAAADAAAAVVVVVVGVVVAAAAVVLLLEL